MLSLMSQLTPVQMIQTSGIGIGILTFAGPILSAVANTPEASIITELFKSGVLGVLAVVLCYAVVRLYQDQQRMVNEERREAMKREIRMQECVDKFTKAIEEYTGRG